MAWTDSSWLIKGYTDEDFQKCISFLSSWNLYDNDKSDRKKNIVNFFGDTLFVSLFTPSYARFPEFDSWNLILLQIKVFGIKESTLRRYFLKATARPGFTRLRVIRQTNRVH